MGGGELQPALDTARRAVRRATALLQDAQTSVGAIREKSSTRDWVTEWDVKAEEVIRAVLSEESPGVPIVGEEGGTSGERAGEDSRWLVNPIDGTVNFAHGLPLFGVCVSLEVRGEPVVGVVGAPALGWECWSAKGHGAFDNGKALAVSEVSTLERAALATGFPYDRAETKHNFRAWEHFQCTAGACRRFGAASLDLCMVAKGWLDGYWEAKLSPWDLSAGALIVTEAGGRVTDLDGSPFASDRGQAVVSNGLIHDEVVRELRPFVEP